jgi:hypothetical protein
VLLGSDRTADDIDGVDASTYASTRNRSETPTGLATFLLDKIADTTDTNVSVVYRVGAEADRLNRPDSRGQIHAFDSRNVYGLSGWTTRGGRGGHEREDLAVETGDVPLRIDDEIVGHARWTLLPEGAPTNNMMPFRGRGHVVARYRDELMFRPNHGSAPKQLAPWGVIVPEVAARTRILIELNQTGPGWHVIQNPARSDLRAADGGTIPWEGFYDQFNDALPDLAAPIWLEMSRIRAAQPRNLDAERRLLSKLRRRIERTDREPEDMAAVDGSGPGSSGAGEPADAGTAQERDRSPNPWPAPTPRRRRPGLPIPEWISPEQWTSDFDYDEKRFAVVVRSGNEILIRYNLGHDIYVSQLEWFIDECSKSRSGRLRRLPRSEIAEAIKEAYHLDSAPRYLWGMRMDPNFREILDRPLSDPAAPCVMTVGAGGFNNVDQAIQADLEARAHGARATTTTTE